MVSNDVPVGPGSPTSLRLANQRRILSVLLDAGGLSQAEIARRTGLAPATVSNIVRELSEAGVLELASLAAGRRGNTVTLSSSIGYALGISIEREYVRMGLATFDRSVVNQRFEKMPYNYSPADAVTVAKRLYQDLLAESSVEPSQVTVGCVVAATSIYLNNTVVSGSPAMPAWAEINLSEYFSDAFNLPIVAENDADAAALAEHLWGRAKEIDNLIYVVVSNGVGAGIMIDGKIYKGSFGITGEIGHICVEPYQEVCQCGNRGCLETIASIPAMLSNAESTHAPVTSFADVVARADQGDARCARQLQRAGEALGKVLAGCCNILNPEMVVIGGEAAVAGETLLGPVRETIRRYAIPSTTQRLEVVESTLGLTAPLNGAIGNAVNIIDLDAILAKVESNS